jgi:hypothetical protein
MVLGLVLLVDAASDNERSSAARLNVDPSATRKDQMVLLRLPTLSVVVDQEYAWSMAAMASSTKSRGCGMLVVAVVVVVAAVDISGP